VAAETGSWEETFPPELDASRRARSGVEGLLRAAGVPERAVAAVLLVVSELVANAIRHAGTDFTVTADLDGDVVRIQVLDQDSRPPALLGFDTESTSGRGLQMVAGLSRDWGWRTAESDGGVSGKVVWAEVETEGPVAPEVG
jgi:anti-sigma regulatory factor (Ser/Thr protein kinase)